ncbi:MAG: GAF domain-containing protein [Chloroflexota bacterium]
MKPWRPQKPGLDDKHVRSLALGHDSYSSEEAQRRLKEAALLGRVITLTASAEDLTTALDEVCQELAHFFGVPQAGFALLNAARTEAEVVAEYRSAGRPRALGAIIPVANNPSMAHILEHKTPLAITDAQSDPRLAGVHDLLRQQGVVSILITPLVINGEVVGTLGIDTAEPREFSPADLTLVQHVANQVGQALARVRLFNHAKEHSRLMAQLASLSISLNQPLSVSEVIASIGQAALTLSQADRAALYVRQANARVSCPWTHRLSAAYVSQILTHLHEVPGGRMLTNTEPILIPDVADLPAGNRLGDLARLEGFRAVGLWPLIYKGYVLAAIGCYYDQPHTWSAAEEDVLRSFALQAGIAFENARLFEAERRQLRLSQTLQRVGALLTTSLTLDEVYEQIFDLLAQVVAYDSVSIHLLDGRGGMVLAAARGFRDPDQIRHLVRAYGPQILTTRWRDPKLQVLPDTRQSQEWLAVRGAEHIFSWIGAPLVVKGQFIGVLNVDSTTPNAYDQETGQTVATFANQAAIALENARLYVERAQLVQSLQNHAKDLSQEVAQRTAELQAAQHRTQAILDNAGEGILFTDTEGIIQYANPAIIRLTGYTAEELLGHTAAVWLADEPQLAQMWATLRAGQVWKGELHTHRQDGATYDVACTSTPILGETGPLGFVSIYSDISRLKELERLKSRFVSNVSHELRTPLTNIKTYVTLLKRGRPENHDYHLSVLDRETERLRRLVQDLLDLSRLDTATYAISLQPTNIVTLLQDAYHSFAIQAEEKQLELVAQWPAALPPAQGDPGALSQVLNNLVGNAILYTPAGGRVILSGGAACQEEPDSVWLRVQDTGPGITAEDMPRLFDRFYRGQAAQDSGAPGTGLGLPISQEIVERLKGRIEVESRPGQGAAFTVWLPVAFENSPQTTQMNAEDSHSAIQPETRVFPGRQS